MKTKSGEEDQFEINCVLIEDIIHGVLRRDNSWGDRQTAHGRDYNK